jgi:iron complex transport system substrate-binding protein
VSPQVSLFALAVTTAAVAVVVERVTPAAMLTPPERPFEIIGRADVRPEASSYPRYATGADNVRVRVQAPPQRIVSQYWSADEFVYSVTAPEHVVGVSESAYLPAVSNVLPLVRRYKPVVATDAEQVLLANPDLVFTPDSARSDLPGLLRAAGLPVYRLFTNFKTLASIEDHIRLVGYLTGDDARADAEAQRFAADIRRAAARRPAGLPPPRVLAFGGLYSYGSDTLLNDILRVLGAENVAATHGFVGYDRVTDEHIVRWNPDWIIVGGDADKIEAVRAQMLARPAIAATNAARTGHVIVMDNKVFLPLSPFTSNLVAALAEALYGKGPS